jgi:hypothetical protein
MEAYLSLPARAGQPLRSAAPAYGHEKHRVVLDAARTYERIFGAQTPTTTHSEA